MVHILDSNIFYSILVINNFRLGCARKKTIIFFIFSNKRYIKFGGEIVSAI